MASASHPSEESPTPLDALLVELETLGAETDARETDRGRRMLNLERPTAELVSMLLRLGRRRSVLEIGTSNGYSTLWLADAMRETGGFVHTVERDPGKHASASHNLRRANLHKLVQQHLGDASAIVPALPGPFDCIFFDADRIGSAQQLQLLLPALSPDVLLLADNAISHAAELQPYIDFTRSLPAFTSMILPVGKGLHIARRSPVS